MVLTVSANNGQAPASALSPLPGVNGDGTSHTAPHVTADSYARLRAAFQRAGLGDLLPTANGWSTYRDRAAQQHMRNIGLTTIPVGQSIHGEWSIGSAVDFQNLGGFGATRHNWLRSNGAEFGWYQPSWAQQGGSLPESWHWEYDQRGDSHFGEQPEPETPVVIPPEDEDMQIIRVIEDGRLILVGTYQFSQIATMDDYNALAQIWGAYQDMSIGDAQRLNDQINRNITDWAHSMAVNIPPLLPPSSNAYEGKTRTLALLGLVLGLAVLVAFGVDLNTSDEADAAYAGSGVLVGGFTLLLATLRDALKEARHRE
jgi:hypothetical protein